MHDNLLPDEQALRDAHAKSTQGEWVIAHTNSVDGDGNEGMTAFGVCVGMKLILDTDVNELRDVREEPDDDGVYRWDEAARRNIQSICLTHNLTPTLLDRLSALRERVTEREHAMHMRIRAEYDKTIADCWRVKITDVEAERDALRAENEKLRERDQMLVHKVATMNSEACKLRERVTELEAEWENARNQCISLSGACQEFIAERDTLRERVAELEKEKSRRCEHCGSDRIYSGPPDCPGCGAPVCCQVCCKENTLTMERDALRERVADLESKHVPQP